jgi:hypothetical protein
MLAVISEFRDLSAMSRERVTPAPDIFATCPHHGKVLEYYKGTFEAVYVSLHPFIRPVSIRKELFKPGTYPSRSVILRNCRPISWAEIAERVRLPSLAAVDIGLRTMILGLKKEFANEGYAAKLAALWETDDLVPPPEGRFSDLLHDSILQSFQDLGYEWLWVGDEFCTERKLYWIDDLKGQDAGPTEGHCNVFTPDKQVLWTTHWDSHFSFLCSSYDKLASLQRTIDLEGFFCSPTTEVYWSVHP